MANFFLQLEGLSVDEAFTLFQDGFGVKESKEMRREKLALQKEYNAERVLDGPIEMSTSKEATYHMENVAK